MVALADLQIKDEWTVGLVSIYVIYRLHLSEFYALNGFIHPNHGSDMVTLFLVCLCLSDAEDRGNPMVSGFQDELDPDDTEPSLPQPKTLHLSKDVTLTSDEEEGVPVAPTITHDQDLDSEPELKE